MSRPASVGLFLRQEDERALMRTVVDELGLRAVDLDAQQFQRALAGCASPAAADASLVDGGLQWIVSDDGSVEWEIPGQPSDGRLFSTHRPALVLVSDATEEDIRKTAESCETRAPDRNAIFAAILTRPLRSEAVRAQLSQAMRAMRCFAERHDQILEELLRANRIFDSVCNGISVCDATLPDLPLIYVNPAFEKITGYSAAEACGRNCRYLQGGERDQPGLAVIREAIAQGREARALLKNYRKDGTPFWNELYLSPVFNASGAVTHFVGIQNDVTQVVEFSERLESLAHYDALTGLANRTLLMERLTQAVLRAGREARQLAVLFFDLNNFKEVNDLFGHEAGDTLLKVIAQRLRASSRANETVARLGGDEFLVVLEGVSDARSLARITRRLTAAMGEPVVLDDREVFPAASVGSAIYPADGQTAAELIKAADLRMYRAKNEARRTRSALGLDKISEHRR